MTKPIEILSLEEVRGHVLQVLGRAQGAKDVQLIHLAVSLNEYLKDAQRWHYAEGHTLPDLSGKQLREFVDAEIVSDRIDV